MASDDEFNERLNERESNVAIAAAREATKAGRGSTQDAITAQLLSMVDHLQRDVIAHMREGSITMADLNADMKLIVVKMDEFLSAFPDKDVVRHRIGHENLQKEEKDKRAFWEKMKFTFWALALTSSVGGIGWIAILVWKAFLLGPK